MTFLHSRYNSQINFSPKDIFDISEEISREFAPSTVIDTAETTPQLRLSSKDMLEISQAISRDFSPEFAAAIPESTAGHKLSPREMFDISEEISREFAPEASAGNLGLVLLPVDPEHLHAYWNIDETQANMTRKIDAGEQLTLRVYSEPDKNAEISQTKPWFDVAINSAQAQQTVPLPIRGDENSYSASIGQRYADNNLTVFATSKTVDAPRGKVTACQKRDDQNESAETMPQKIISPHSATHHLSKNASGQSNSQ